MDEAVQKQPEEPRAAVQPCTGDENRRSAHGEGELQVLLLLLISQNYGAGV